MRKILRATGVALVIGAGLSGCYPERASQPNNYSSVTTVYDTLMAFDSVTTFYVPDSVIHVGGADDITHVYDSLITAEIAAWMVSRGYTQVTDPAMADLTLNPAVTVSGDWNYNPADWCDVWGWAYPWLCTGWIPDYPSDPIGFEYSTGTLMIFMADLSGGVPPAVSRPPVVWFAGINGALNGNSSSALAARISDGIGQAFYQSPYIYRVNP